MATTSKITIPVLKKRKANQQKISMITAYDYPSACLVDTAGIDIVLVGDSCANVVLGYENTIPIKLEELLHHTKAVRRGLKRAMLVFDMPFLSYGVRLEDTLYNAGRALKEAGAEAVKVEGGVRSGPTIEALVKAQIPVMGHLGLTPQSVHTFGGYRVQGKSLDIAQRLLQDALAIEAAGAFSLVIEGVPAAVSRIITESVSIPTIGIGAGPHCDGQVLVFHDLLGLSPENPPKFVKKYLEGYQLMLEAVKTYIDEVTNGSFPAEEHCYPVDPKLIEALKDEKLSGS